MAFLKPANSLRLQTSKGEIEILNTEYFVLQDKNGREPLVINKEGTQKIEDFFDAQTEIIGEGALLENIYVKVRMSTPEGLKVERLGSANNKSLTNEIARAYAVEMAFKRACATAALEVLRKNYTGSEPLPLLYSSFDEFKTEDSLNQNVPVVEQPVTEQPAAKQPVPKVETPVETPAKTENSDMDEASKTAIEENPFKEKPIVEEQPVENKTETSATEEKPADEKEPAKTDSNDGTIASNLGSFLIKSNKYRNGITLAELAEKDKNYLTWLVNGDNMKGRYKDYQENARKYVKEAGINLTA